MAVPGLRSGAQLGGRDRGQHHELGAMGDTPEAVAVTGDLHFVAGHRDACTYMDARISPIPQRGPSEVKLNTQAIENTTYCTIYYELGLALEGKSKIMQDM